MANNLVIVYDLYSPGQRYAAVEEKIKALGTWSKIANTTWFVSSNRTTQEAVNIIWAVMDRNDRLFVVDATNNVASWQGLPDEVAKHIIAHWSVR